MKSELWKLKKSQKFSNFSKFRFKIDGILLNVATSLRTKKTLFTYHIHFALNWQESMCKMVQLNHFFPHFNTRVGCAGGCGNVLAFHDFFFCFVLIFRWLLYTQGRFFFHLCSSSYHHRRRHLPRCPRRHLTSIGSGYHATTAWLA